MNTVNLTLEIQFLRSLRQKSVLQNALFVNFDSAVGTITDAALVFDVFIQPIFTETFYITLTDIHRICQLGSFFDIIHFSFIQFHDI